MKLKTLAVTLLATVVLGACSSDSTNEANSPKETETASVNLKELVHEYSVGNLDKGSASITSHELILAGSDGKKTIFDLSDENFFVSIAPYVNETHP